MVMDLILWRHAEAHPAVDGQLDLDRPLTAKGERQAARMAQWLNQRLPQGARVIVSPAVRTQQTAAALEREFKTVRALAPDAPLADLLAAAATAGGAGWRRPVLVVGHQPTLGLAAAELLCGQPQPWSVRKGAVWWLRGRERDGGRQVVLTAVQVPELL